MVEKYLAHAGIAGTDGLEYANHVGLLENDDEQARNHIHSRDERHQHQNDPHVHIQQREPVKYLRIKRLDGLYLELAAVVEKSVSDFVPNRCVHLLQLVVVGEGDFKSADLVWCPIIEFLDVLDVGQHHHFVKVLKIGLVDPRYAKFAVADIFGIFARHETGDKTASHLELHRIGNAARNDHLIGTASVAHLWQAAFDQMLAEKQPVKISPDSLDHHALNRLPRADNPRFGGIYLNVFYAFHRLQCRQEALLSLYRYGFVRRI